MRKLIYICLLAFTGTIASIAQETVPTDSIPQLSQSLDEVTVVKRRAGQRWTDGAVNGVTIHKEELFKAACCNLGESFTTNPSVDVNYSDAATGAQQIRLLGLSGTYVQMLTENIPNFRGAAIPYALGYVPGSWMKSILVSKGTSSVKNGYESITGQIDVEYLKPDDDQGLIINLYEDMDTRTELNVDVNRHLSQDLSTEILAHYSDIFRDLDDNNDGFLDEPKTRQLNLQNRWKWETHTGYLFHAGVSLLDEKRESGQIGQILGNQPFRIQLNTRRYEGYMKHAYILDQEKGTNIALMGSASMHQLDAEYGHKSYWVNEKNAYAQLMFETNLTPVHNLSLGLSMNHDYLGQRYNLVNTKASPTFRQNERETTPGAYVQYTLNLNGQLIAMAGFRADHSSVYGMFYTPRLHLKYTPGELLTLRLSAGKGYRTVHVLAENNYLLSSGRLLVIDDLDQESAWNYGANAQLSIPLFGETLKVNAEYYYTHFNRQAVIDYDSDPKQIRITSLDGRSYSHTFQIDASYPIVEGLELTAAYRLNDVKTTYGGQLREKPLTSRYKGLFTASYKTPLGKWQFDATLQLNGGGRMPDPYSLPDGSLSWDRRYRAFEQVNAQITRWFRHFSIYIGGENLTSVIQDHPILHADEPWSSEFEPTMIWGPVSGAMFYAGIRFNFGRL